ncbi:hypothetical protein QBC36DRAFT_325259, partial [Triangularia setosa]
MAYRQIHQETSHLDTTISGLFFSWPNVFSIDNQTAGWLCELSTELAALQAKILSSTVRYREPLDCGNGVWTNTLFSLCFSSSSYAEKRQAALRKILNWMSDVVSLGETPHHELGGPDGICLVFPLLQSHDWIENEITDWFLESHNYGTVRRPVADQFVEVPSFGSGSGFKSEDEIGGDREVLERSRGGGGSGLGTSLRKCIG